MFHPEKFEKGAKHMDLFKEQKILLWDDAIVQLHMEWIEFLTNKEYKSWIGLPHGWDELDLDRVENFPN